MKKYEKLTTEIRTATKITANAEKLSEKDGITGYALMWLKLTNTARENSNEFLKIYNNYYDDIYIICENNSVKAIKDYLVDLGLEITDEEQIVILEPEIIFPDVIDCFDEMEIFLLGYKN